MVFPSRKKTAQLTQIKLRANLEAFIALINFKACWTRPDIAFITNKLCKFMSNPGDIHWLRTLIKYLAPVIYDMKNPQVLTLHGYTDSSFGSVLRRLQAVTTVSSLSLS